MRLELSANSETGIKRRNPLQRVPLHKENSTDINLPPSHPRENITDINPHTLGGIP